jgi:hypothetical protein
MSGATAFSGYAALGAAIVDGVLTEPVGGGYARQAVSGQDLGNGQITLSAGMTFGPASASWGTIGEFAIFDAAAGGTMRNSVALASFTVGPNELVTVPPGTYQMTPGAVMDAAVLTLNGAQLTIGGQPVRMA